FSSLNSRSRRGSCSIAASVKLIASSFASTSGARCGRREERTAGAVLCGRIQVIITFFTSAEILITFFTSAGPFLGLATNEEILITFFTSEEILRLFDAACAVDHPEMLQIASASAKLQLLNMTFPPWLLSDNSTPLASQPDVTAITLSVLDLSRA